MGFRGFRLKKAVIWTGLAWLGFALLREARGPGEEPLGSSKGVSRPDSQSPPKDPDPRWSEQGRLGARNLAWLFAAVFLFVAGAAMGGAFGASANEVNAVAGGSLSNGSTDTTIEAV